MSSNYSGDDSAEPVRSGLGARSRAQDSSSEDSDSSSASSAPDLDASGLPSTFGGSKARKRRRVDRPEPSLPSTNANEEPPAHWERHTLGFGSKILAKHGFKGRLGAKADGIAAPVQPVLRPAGLGLGAGAFREKPHAEVVKEQLDERNAQTATETQKEKKWKKKTQKRPRAKREKDIVVDMRGATPRQLPSLAAALATDEHATATESEKVVVPDPLFAVPEIAYNLRMLTDTARLQFDKAKRRKEAEKLIKDTAMSERKKVGEELANAKNVLAELEVLERRVKKLFEKAGEGTDSDFEALLNEFTAFGRNFLKTGYIAPSCVMDALADVVHKRVDGRLAECMSKTNKLSRKNRLRQARHICRVLKAARETLSDELYITLCTQLVLRRARRVVARADWDAVEGAWVAEVLAEMRSALPEAVVEAFGEEVLVPRLVGRIERWTEKDAPLHMWIHPWLPVVGRRSLVEVLGRVRVILNRVVERWGVKDGMDATLEVIELVRRWTGVLSRRKMQLMLARHVTPKVVKRVEMFCKSDMELGGYVAGRGVSIPECFHLLEMWGEVVSWRLMSDAIVGPMCIGLCARMRKLMFADGVGTDEKEREEVWKRGCEYYKMWKSWIPGGMLEKVRCGLGAILFVLHAGRIEERMDVRRKLALADVSILLKNRFVRTDLETDRQKHQAGKEEAIERWKAGRMSVKETVMHVARREGLSVVGGKRLSNGQGVLHIGGMGGMRVTVDGRRGVLLAVEGEEAGRERVRVVSIEEMVRLAKARMTLGGG